MFFLIWATLLLSVRGSFADAATSPGEKDGCQNGFCITLNEAALTAEVGLCVVLPCSFTTNHSFTPERVIWYKFPSEENSTASQIIFHSNKTNPNVQTGFRGRVSLLEPDLSKRNCSIIINDLTESDSGSYHLSINDVLNGATNRSTLSIRASVKDLSQKPTVTIPPLTEGQQATLTCTAPGVCSGSVPTITWTWRGTGENNTQITGNFMTKNLTAVTQTHTSTLIFNSSAEHHGTTVTCKVSFIGNKTTEETVTLNVTYVRKLKILGTKVVEEGDALNLTCSIDSFPPSLITWTRLGSNKTLHKATTTVMQGNMRTATLVISNVTAAHSGQYICTAKHLHNTLTERVDITVKCQTMKWLRTVPWLEIIIAFFIGALFSATFCCLVRKCHRKKQSTNEHLAETLEMATSQEGPLIRAGETVEDYQIYQNQETTEEGAAGKSDVEYSSIDFFLLKRNSPTKAGNSQETKETEYTEIKREEAEGRQGGESKEEEVMIEEDEETKHHIPEEKDGEDVALYSNVKDIMGQI